MNAELLLTSAVVAAVVALIGVALGKTVELMIARRNIQLEYDRRRAEYKMKIFSEYNSKMHAYRRAIDERWMLADMSPEWKVRMSAVLNELTTTPVQLLLTNAEAKAFYTYAEKAGEVAEAFIDLLDFDSDLYELAGKNATEILRERMRQNPKRYRRKKVGVEEAMELFISESENHVVAEVQKREEALEQAEIQFQEVLRKNLQRDLHYKT